MVVLHLLRRKLRVLLVVCAGLGIASAVFTALLAQGPVPFDHPPQRTSIAHASGLEVVVPSSCAACHENPITTVACAQCHTGLVTTLQGGVLFPHHDGGGDAPTCVDCHSGGTDVRVINKPAPDHAYCEGCHLMNH
ncbi:MAG: hypothetical protein HY681_14890 [Chloroflexi bacterium]|nr:hypothetical protein [Chloroflexota bacterium]